LVANFKSLLGTRTK